MSDALVGCKRQVNFELIGQALARKILYTCTCMSMEDDAIVM